MKEARLVLSDPVHAPSSAVLNGADPGRWCRWWDARTACQRAKTTCRCSGTDPRSARSRATRRRCRRSRCLGRFCAVRWLNCVEGAVNPSCWNNRSAVVGKSNCLLEVSDPRVHAPADRRRPARNPGRAAGPPATAGGDEAAPERNRGQSSRQDAESTSTQVRRHSLLPRCWEGRVPGPVGRHTGAPSRSSSHVWRTRDRNDGRSVPGVKMGSIRARFGGPDGPGHVSHGPPAGEPAFQLLVRGNYSARG